MDGLKKVYEAAGKAAAENAQMSEGDYIKDGLLYCGKCHTPKQCRVNNPFIEGKTDIMPCMCDCKVEEKKRIEDARRKWEKDEQIKNLKNIGFPDAELRQWTFENDNGGNAKIMTALKNYVDNFAEFKADKKGVVLYGDVGTGKTYAAACVVNALIEKGVPCLMTNFIRLTNILQGLTFKEDKQKYIDSLNEFDLIVFDDLAAERQTEYMQEIVYNFIDSRYRSGKPFIITTNLSIEQLKEPETIQNARSFDRILERCFPLEVAGSSHRRKNIIADYEKTKKMLGI